MTRKVLIDCDPGIDDAVALCLALFDPRLEVLAVTAAEGNAHAEQTSRNVQAIVEQIDPPRYPRFGVAQPAEVAPVNAWGSFHGTNGLGNYEFNVSLLHHQHPSDKVINDVVRAYPEDITILALGPLTNVARALQRDPHLATMIRRIIIMGGSVEAIGNVTACAEFNMYYDPDAARAVFNSPTTKTLIPLDVTRQIVFSLDFLDQLPDAETRVGAFLHRVIPFFFRAHRQRLGLEGIHLHDAVALMAIVQPELFQTRELHGDVATDLGLTRGVTVFDRRDFPGERPNMEVAVKVDGSEVQAGILRGLKYAGQQSA
jgi:purine nucleosidase